VLYIRFNTMTESKAQESNENGRTRSDNSTDRQEREALTGSIREGGALVAPQAILPPGFVLPSTAPVEGNPAVTIERPAGTPQGSTPVAAPTSSEDEKAR